MQIRYYANYGIESLTRHWHFHDIEQSKRDESLFRIKYIILINKDVGRESDQWDDKWGTGPNKGRSSVKICSFFQHVHLFSPNVHDLLFETWLPRIQL